MIAPARLLALAVWLSLVVAGASRAAEPAAPLTPAAPAAAEAAKAPAVPGRLEYRQVFTPVDQIEALSQGFLPLERKRFESLVSLLETAGAAPAGKTLARISRADYQARLTDDDVLTGEGEWIIESSTAEPTLMKLEACGLALSNVRWEGGEKTSGTLGVGASGKPVALVQGAGKFRFHWTLRPQSDSASSRFVLSWPSAGWIRLGLDLPASAVPEVEGGLAQEIPPSKKEGAERRQWTILSGGRDQTVVQIPRRRETPVAARGERLRQQFNYLVEERGGRFTAELELDVPSAALRELPLEVGAGLRLTAAWYGDNSLTWDRATTPKGEMPGSQMVRLNLPEGVAGPSREVRIEGVFSLPAGELTALPRLIVHGVSWQQGDVALQVLSPLTLRQLQVTDSRQTGSAPLSAGEGGTSFEFQEFQRDAKYEIEVAVPEPELALACSTQLEFGAAAETARWDGDFSSLAGAERTLTGDLARVWVVEGVESQPADAISHWNVENRPPGQQRLVVQLARAIKPGEPLRLQIRAHRAAARVGSTLPADRLRLIEFQNVRVDERVLLLRAESPWRIVPGDKGPLPLVELNQLTPAQARRIDVRPESLVLRDEGPRVPELSLASEPPHFTADLTCEVRAEAGSLAETLRVRCSPLGSSLSSLTVLLAPGGGGAWRWSLADDATETVLARRLDGGDAPSASFGELWELSWRRPRTVPFEITGQRSEEFKKSQPVVLATAPAANSQTGSLLVFAAFDTHVRALTDRLKPLLTETPAAGRLPLLAAYRYEPTEDPYFPSAQVTLAPAAAPAGAARGWAWSAAHRIHLSPAGEVRYRSSFRLEGAQPGLEITLPEEALLREARLDGTRLSLAAGAAPNVWKMMLVPARRTCLLEVDFTRPAARLPAYGTLRLPVAQLNIPTYEAWAEVALPADFAGTSAHGGTASSWNLWPQNARSRPFQPFSLGDWRWLIEGDALLADARQQGRRSYDVLATLWQQQRGNANSLTWGDFLTQADARLAEHRDEAGAAPRWLIDVAALRSLGLGPGTAIEWRDETNFGRVLAGANLVWLIQGDKLLLTSAAEAAAWSGQWQWIENEPYAAVLPGELSDVLNAATSSPTRFATVSAWTTGARETGPAVLATTRPEPFGNRALPVVVQRPLAGAEVELVVFRPLLWRAWGWAMCLIAAAGTMLASRRSWLWVVVLGALAILLNLFLPGPLAPLAQGAMLGVVLGYLLTLVRVRERVATMAFPPEASTVEAMPVAVGRTATLWLCFVATAALHTTLVAQENGAARSPYQVLVPVDERQQPVGEYWYLQKSFYEALLGRVSTLQTGEAPWLLKSAQYQAEVSERGAQEVVLQYTLDTLHAAATVRLPLRRAEMELIPDRALLDGRPVPLEWSADERSLALVVPESGTHRLELAVKPAREKMESERGFEFTVPAVMESRLEIVCQGVRAAEVKVPTALGAVSVSADDRRVTADLGATPQLAVRWPATPGDAAPLVDATKDAFYWLRIRPGSVVLAERVKLTVQRGEVRQLRLTVGSQLRLLPLAADHAVSEAVPDPSTPGSYLLKFRQPITTELTFDMSFLVTDISGVGRLDVPLPKVEGVRVNRRWLAVSPDATLECEPIGKPSGETISPAQFVAAWGVVDEPPALVARVAADDRTWPIAVRVREPRVKATERNDVIYDAEQVVIRYEAQVEVLASSLFKFRLQLPAGMEVKHVGVLDDKTPEPVRYSVSGNLLTVFLEGPASKLQTLALEGRLPAPPGAGQTVPLVRLLDYKPAVSLVRLARSSAVLVDVVADALAKPAAPAALPELPRSERALGAWELPPLAAANTAGPSPLRATVTPNVVQCTGRVITELSRLRDEWSALADLNLTVAQGELDVVAIDLPATWSEGLALVLEPAPPFIVQSLPDKSRKRLLIWPREPIAKGDAQFKLRLRCQPGAGERLLAPRLAVPAASELAEYLLLPLRSDRQRLAWDTSGMRVTNLPPGVTVPPGNADKTLVLRVLDSQASASVARVEQALAQPVVRLADIRVTWEAGDRYVGIAAYDLDPAQLTQVQLRLPDGAELVRAESSGVVLTAEDLGAGRVQCSLPVAQLPQRLEVVFTGTLVRLRSGVVEFRSPELIDIPIDHTLWTVWPPANLGMGRLSAAGEAHVFRQELYRLRSAAALVEAGRGVVSDRPASEIASWYAAWARHVGSVERRVAQLERMPGGSDPFDAAEAGRLTAAHDRSAAALGQASTRERFSANRTVESVSFASATAPAWEGALTASVEGAVTQFDVQVNRPASTAWTRWLAAAALFVGVGLLFALRLQGPLGDWLVRWPHAGCLIAGILAWMWFSPSLVGLVIVLASSAAALAGLVRTRFAKAPA